MTAVSILAVEYSTTSRTCFFYCGLPGNRVLKEAGDDGEIDMPTWNSRHSGGAEDEEFARVLKVERNINEDRYILWYREQLGENDAGERTFRDRITCAGY